MSTFAWIFHELADMDHQCPNLECLAPPNEYCRRPDGYMRRLPCLARMKRPDLAEQALIEQLRGAAARTVALAEKESGR